MDRVVKVVKEWVGLVTVVVGLVLYQERRMASLEHATQSSAERLEEIRARIEVLARESVDRLAIAPDGGFAQPAVRAMVSRSLELEASRLQLFDQAAAERFGAALEQRIREAVRTELRAGGK